MTTPDDLRDAELSRRYRALSPELPHPDTDAAIRSAARDAVTARPRRVSPGALYGGLAMAASVTLMVALLLPSWRSGELREQVAVRSPAPSAADPPGPVAAGRSPRAGVDDALRTDRFRVTAAADTPSPTLPAPRRAPPPLAVALSPPAASGTTRGEDVAMEGVRSAVATASAPAEASTLAPAPAEASDVVQALPAAGAMPAPASPPPREAPAASALDDMASRERDVRADRARAGEAQKAASALPAARERRVRPEADSKPLQAAPPWADETASLDALVRAARYRDALALLQASAATADPALASRRDLLRQLLPDEDKALTCGADVGPASSRRLCALLRAYQRGEAPGEELRDAFRQALLDEGTDPAPWLQAVSRLP